MPEEINLEQFKVEFTRDYVDRSLDRLLDLRNAVKTAQTPEAINALIHMERTTVLHDMGIEVKPRKKDATKEIHSPDSEEGKEDNTTPNT